MAFKEYVYLGVEVLTAMKHQYIFTERCWATPNADPQRQIINKYIHLKDLNKSMIFLIN